MGSCVAGGAYLPIMSDEALIVNKTGTIFLAGSYLVKAAIGEDIDNETLGGATTHCEISGVTDYKSEDDKNCLNTIRSIMDKVGDFEKAGFNRIEAAAPKKDEKELYGIMPAERAKPYQTMDIIERLVDKSEFEEYKAGFGQSIVCGYARIDGWAVGIVANQRQIVKSKKGEMQFGGVIYSDSADKASRFIANCNQKKIPLVFLQDVTGFMVGSRSEHGGIIKDGAKMVNAMSNSVVPKFTIVMGNSYGAGNYAMCGKAYDPRLIVAWPTAQIAVMGGAQAAKVLLQIEKASLKAKGEEIDEKAEQKLLKTITDRYNEQTSPYYAASRLWVDAIIDPLETRKVISMGIEAANNAPLEKRIIQELSKRKEVKQKRHIVMLLTIASILLAPLIAMQFSTEVQWTAGDFIIAAILLSSFALLIEFLIRKKQQGKRRTAIILLAILTLLLLWGEMAVGLL